MCFNMPDAIDPQLSLFRRQYFQLFEPDFLAWPPAALLKEAGVQSWLYKNLFDDEKNSRLPPQRYQVRVLKPLIGRIEKAIDDPEEDVGFDAARSYCLLSLITETSIGDLFRQARSIPCLSMPSDFPFHR